MVIVPLILDDSTQEAREALLKFLHEWNDTHVDTFGSVSVVMWVEKGRLYPVNQGFVFGYDDLKVGE